PRVKVQPPMGKLPRFSKPCQRKTRVPTLALLNLAHVVPVYGIPGKSLAVTAPIFGDVCHPGIKSVLREVAVVRKPRLEVHAVPAAIGEAAQPDVHLIFPGGVRYAKKRCGRREGNVHVYGVLSGGGNT